jgi:predicted AAA+ superfamily ATPase
MSDIIDENEIDIEVNKHTYQDKAIQLIDFRDNKFELNPEALELINSIEEEIIIVAVVGKARTGKSYLMNLLLDNIGKNKGVDFFNLVRSRF